MGVAEYPSSPVPLTFSCLLSFFVKSRGLLSTLPCPLRSQLLCEAYPDSELIVLSPVSFPGLGTPWRGASQASMGVRLPCGKSDMELPTSPQMMLSQTPFCFLLITQCLSLGLGKKGKKGWGCFSLGFCFTEEKLHQWWNRVPGWDRTSCG